MPELKLGSSGDAVFHWYDWAFANFKAYNFLLGKRDGYYGNDEAAFTRELQRRLAVPITGRFGDLEASRTGYRWAGTTTPPKPVARRPIWMYTAPGSGAPWNVGPPFDVGERCKNVLHINHQPIGYPIGGYLGLMGGDPAFSYQDVIGFLKAELRRQIEACPDLTNPNVEFWFVGYSQSADGMLEAVKDLFGDGGEFAHLRPRVNGVICFGNPATQGTGIARKTFPDWLNRLTRNVNHDNDFYAVATDRIRPLFYEWFVEADTDVPFIVYSAQIVIPAITGLLPGVGALMAAPLSMLLSVIPGGQAGAKKKPNPELIKLLSAQGLLTSIPDLMALVAALPGLQAHGFYDPQPGFDIVAAFRR